MKWEIFESEHYRFHVKKESCALKEIEKIITLQEACYHHISRVLGIVSDFRIAYFLCDTAEEVGDFYGDGESCNGFARMPNQVYAVYNETVKCIGFHEDAHLISYQLCRPEAVALREGLAMFFDRKWWGIANDDWVNFYLSTDRYKSIVDLFDNTQFYDLDCSITYPIVGSFVDYLVTTYGIDCFLKLYQSDKPEEVFQTIYHLSFGALEKEFIQYISLFRLDEGLKARMEELLV